MVQKRYEYTVVGYVYFPMDMLRYDACWPRTSEAVSRMGDSLDDRIRRARQERSERIPYEVELASHVKAPTTGRWQSFGWYVKHDSLREVKL